MVSDDDEAVSEISSIPDPTIEVSKFETPVRETAALQASAESPGRALLTYTIYRLLVFAAALVALYVLGARSYLLVALAIVISGLISLVVLDRQRDGVAPMVKKFTSRINDRIESGKRKEDSASDSASDSLSDSSSDASIDTSSDASIDVGISEDRPDASKERSAD